MRVYPRTGRFSSRTAVTQMGKEAMRNSKFGLRAFGLALMAALGLMAFSAVAAQAENLSDGGKAAKFLVGGSAALSVGATFSAEQVGTGTLLVPGRVDILCTKGTTSGEVKNETDASGNAEFTGCTAWQPVTVLGASHVTKAACTVKEPIKAEGLALPKKHEGNSYILLEQKEGSALFTTIFLEGAECPLTKENKVTGSVVGLIDKNGTTEPTLLFSHEIQKLFQTSATLGDHLKFGAFESYIDAEAKGKITGPAPDVGQTLGVC